MNNLKTVLVTGGAGFIGSHTVNKLCDLGHTVRVIDDLSFGRKEFIDSRATFYEGSLDDTELLIEALTGVDIVMHFAASSIIKFSIENPLSYINNNVVNGTKLIDAMRKCNVSKIIFSSSASVYGEPIEIPIKESHPKNPMQPYGASKLAFESILSGYYHSYGIESVSLRFFNVYGPRDEQMPATRAVPIWIKAILNNEPIKMYWNGNQLRDYIYVEDVATAHISVMNLKGCLALNIGSGNGILMKDLCKEIQSEIGKQVEIIDSGKRLGDPEKLVADTTTIQQMTDWRPQTALSEGIKKTVSYYTSRHLK